MKSLNNLINIIYPPACGFCNNLSNNYLCPNCQNDLAKLKVSSIQKYNSSNFFFSEHFYLFKYQNEIRKHIIDYKFNEKSYLFKSFSQIFKQDLEFKNFISKYDCILSVPLHKKRLHTRGYNQSELIAKEISKYFNIPYYNDILFKTSNITMQSSLNKENRKSNILNAFSVCNKEKILNKKVIIFDDIFTTGSTANECAKVLLNSGACKIGIVTIAKD